MKNTGFFNQKQYISKEQWTEWGIELSDFNDVDLTSVNKIYIGFGDRENRVAGGNGTVYFDDIRLYAGICVPGFGPPADFDDDCVVGRKDLGIMAGEWLQSDDRITPVERNPTAGGLVVPRATQPTDCPC